ncbi:MAG TPA: HD domain-containing protein [bacterium]|nr:HD domain-containing protein [bacterium]HPP87360.1 HD domain-containing protein [bacterium]
MINTNPKELIGIIDIGANSVKLNISSCPLNKKNTIIENLWMPVAIGKDIYSKKIITGEALNDLINILIKFKETLDIYGVSEVRVIATSALRQAKNLDAVIGRIQNEIDLKVEILEPIIEAEILFETIKNKIEKNQYYKNENILIFAIDSSITIIIYISKGKIIFSETQNIGTLEMLRIYELPQKSIEIFINYISSKMLNSLLCFDSTGYEKINKIIILNDDMLDILKKSKDIHKNQILLTIDKQRFEKITDHINKIKISHTNEILLGEILIKSGKIAIKIFNMVCALIKTEQIIIPNINRMTALLEKMPFLKKGSFYELNVSLKDNIISAAVQLGYKYKFDYNHAMKVKEISEKIYEFIKDYYNFKPKSGFYLQIAAILHDIGYFVNPKDHHLHSEYLIKSADILGLDNYDLKLISEIVKYHRKLDPQQNRNELSSFTPDDRVAIACLAGILKISETLDKSHSGLVEDIKIQIKNETLKLFLKLKGNNYEHLEILRMLLKEKSDIFENFFNLQIVIDKM